MLNAEDFYQLGLVIINDGYIFIRLSKENDGLYFFGRVHTNRGSQTTAFLRLNFVFYPDKFGACSKPLNADVILKRNNLIRLQIKPRSQTHAIRVVAVNPTLCSVQIM